MNTWECWKMLENAGSLWMTRDDPRPGGFPCGNVFLGIDHIVSQCVTSKSSKQVWWDLAAPWQVEGGHSLRSPLQRAHRYASTVPVLAVLWKFWLPSCNCNKLRGQHSTTHFYERTNRISKSFHLSCSAELEFGCGCRPLDRAAFALSKLVSWHILVF